MGFHRKERKYLFKVSTYQLKTRILYFNFSKFHIGYIIINSFDFDKVRRKNNCVYTLLTIDWFSKQAPQFCVRTGAPNPSHSKKNAYRLMSKMRHPTTSFEYE